jgi:hypothetical protein
LVSDPLFLFKNTHRLTHVLVTDISFHSQRRHFQQFAVAEGVKSFGYHFVDPAASPAPAYGGQSSLSCPEDYFIWLKRL